MRDVLLVKSSEHPSSASCAAIAAAREVDVTAAEGRIRALFKIDAFFPALHAVILGKSAVQPLPAGGGTAAESAMEVEVPAAERQEGAQEDTKHDATVAHASSAAKNKESASQDASDEQIPKQDLMEGVGEEEGDEEDGAAGGRKEEDNSDSSRKGKVTITAADFDPKPLRVLEV